MEQATVRYGTGLCLALPWQRQQLASRRRRQVSRPHFRRRLGATSRQNSKQATTARIVPGRNCKCSHSRERPLDEAMDCCMCPRYNMFSTVSSKGNGAGEVNRPDHPDHPDSNRPIMDCLAGCQDTVQYCTVLEASEVLPVASVIAGYSEYLEYLRVPS